MRQPPNTKIKDKQIDKLCNILAIPMILFTVWFLYKILTNMFLTLEFPHEYREAVNVAFTECILKGENPYSVGLLEKAIPGVCYLYPFGYSLFVALLGKILPIDLVLLHYLIGIFCMLSSAGIAAFLVKKRSRTVLEPLFAFQLVLVCHWRYGYTNVTIDSFGILIIMVALLILCSQKVKHKELWMAVFTVWVFYIKQYFVLLAFTTIIFYLFISKKKTIKYILYSALITISSIILVTIFLPTYWTYAFYLLKGSEEYFSFEQLRYAIGQFGFIGQIYCCLFLIIFAIIVKSFIRREVGLQIRWKDMNAPLLIRRNEISEIEMVFWIHFFVCGFGLLYFGLNNGAYLTYFLQLWGPSIIIIGIISFTKFAMHEKKPIIYLVLYISVIVITVFLNDRKLPYHALTQEEIATWDEAYDLLDQYDEGNVYFVPSTAFYALEHEQYVYDLGHVGITTQKDYDRWSNSKFSQTIFPYAGAIIQQHMNWRRQMNGMMEKQEYSLITRVDGNDLTFTEEALAEYYEKYTTLPLRLGNMVYETEFWIPKK